LNKRRPTAGELPSRTKIDIPGLYKDPDRSEVSLEIDDGWLQSFQAHLTETLHGRNIWLRLEPKLSAPRNLIDTLYLFTTSASTVVDKRLLFRRLEKRFKRFEKTLVQMENALKAEHSNSNVTLFTDSPFEWPRERKEFDRLLEHGIELSREIAMHYKAQSHAGSEQTDYELFLTLVFDLRYRRGCKYADIATLFQCAFSASKREEGAEAYDEEKLKDSLKRLRRKFPGYDKKLRARVHVSLTVP
jgi:hypothetical protein